jgi:hypothetical protein
VATSEPTFILQAIHEYGEPWWNDINRGQILICSPELSRNPTSSHLVANKEELGNRDDEFGLRNIFVHTSKLFLNVVKSYDMGPQALFPLQRKLCCGFVSPVKIHHLSQI